MRKLLQAAGHILIVLAGAGLLLGLPFVTSDYYQAKRAGLDAVSSASVILDAPSGEYIVQINRDLHRDEKNLATWQDFFAGKEISFIFEDIFVSVPAGDSAGLEMARSYQSRLPENQMKIEACDPTLLFSRADHMKYDMIVVSREFADSYGLTAPEDRAIRIEVGGEGS